MRKTAILLAMTLVLVTLIPTTTSGSEQPTKAELLPLFVEHGTYRFDNSTGSVMFDTVTIGEAGRLEIVGVSFVASRIITIQEEVNSSIYIDGTQESWGYLTVTKGMIDVQVDRITLGRAEIKVMWTGAPTSSGEAGRSSFLKMETLGGGIEATGSNIEVIGQDGGNGDVVTYGGSGGESLILLEDTGGGNVDLGGTWIRSLGGKGGGGPSGDVNSGEGGQSDISIEGKSVEITRSFVMSLGGKAGPVSQGAIGSHGGSGMMRIRSGEDLTLRDTDLTTLPGNNSGKIIHPSPSTILFQAKNGTIRWDHNKSDDDKRSTLSYLVTPSLQLDAKFGAHFHQVHMGETIPTSLESTDYSVYWWVDLFVRDDLGTPIKNAIVYYNINDGIETYPDASTPLIAGENGYVSIELRSNDGPDWRRYRFFGQFGGLSATGGTDTIRLNTNSNQVDEIRIKIADVDVHTDLEVPILDLWNITGTAFNRLGTPIAAMELFINDEFEMKAIGTSKDPSESFSEWYIPFNTSKLAPGSYVFDIRITIGDFITKLNWTVELSRSFFNHPPVVDQVALITKSDLIIASNNTLHQIHVTPLDPQFRIDITIMENDHGSDLLSDGEGVWVTEMETRIMMYGRTLEVFSKRSVFTTFDAGDNGRYHSSLFIDTSRRQGSYDPWPSGKFLVLINGVDDGGLAAREIQILIELHIDQPPLLQLRLGKETLETPTPHPTRSENAFYLENPEDRELTKYFDLTGCKDLDDPGYFPHPTLDRSWMNLTTTVYIQPEGDDPVLVIRPFKGFPGFSHTFDLKNYSEDDVVLFEIYLHVVDKDGVVSEMTVLTEVTITEPMHKENRLPFWIIALSVMMWIAAMLVAFIIILPIYTRRRKDKVRRLLKDPTLKAVTIEAMKGEKPSNFLISREVVVEGLINKMETGKIPKTEYEQIANDIKTAQEKVSINSDKVK